jgi:cell division protein FtsQ
VLDAAVTGQEPKARKPRKAESAAGSGPVQAASLRRDLGEDFAPRRRAIAPTGAMVRDDEDYAPRRMGRLRLRLRGGIPPSTWGKVLAGGFALGALVAGLSGLWALRAVLLASPRLVLESSSAIQITGNSHLTRAQLLTVFGGDVDRNIMTVSLADRRAQLERLPWVEHATVMRLLPNHFRVAIEERRPVAFARQGNSIGLVDAHGVLLDMASDGDANRDMDRERPAEAHYSFPVVTGIAANDPLTVRAARMRLFARFLADLGEHGKEVSDVDLSNPEDIKALIPDGGTDILVHFGDKDFLHRYELYEKNLPGWKAQYPKLASADMRYQRQVVLEMQPNSVVPVNEAADKDKAAQSPAKAAGKAKGPVKAALPTAPKGRLTKAYDLKSKSATKSTQAGPQ